MNELVSVILPVYNTEKTLDRTVESVIKQTYSNLEIIIIDDGSTIETSKKCDEWSKKDCRIRCIHKKNEGLGMTRNAGINEANGEYIVFFDTDDYVEYNMIEKMLSRAVQNGADMVSTTFIMEDTIEQNSISPGIYENVREYLLPRLFGRLNALDNDFFNVSACTKMYDLRFIKANKLYFKSEREYIWEDMEFNARFLLSAKRVFVLSDSFYHYCYNADSTTHIYDPSKFKRIIKMFEYFKRFIIDNKLNKESYSRLCFSIMGNIRMCIKQVVLFCSMTDSLKEIKVMCNNSSLLKIAKVLETTQLSPQQKLLNKFLIKKNYIGIYLLAKLQNFKTKGVID